MKDEHVLGENGLESRRHKRFLSQADDMFLLTDLKCKRENGINFTLPIETLKCLHLKPFYSSFPFSRLMFQSQFRTSQILIFSSNVLILARAFSVLHFKLGFLFLV